MSGRKTVLAFLALALLLGYFYGIERKQDAAKVAARKLFPGLVSDQVTRIRVERREGWFELARKGTRWWVSDRSGSDPADPTQVEELLATLGTLTKGKEFPAADLTQYALSPPKITLSVTMSSGSPEPLLLGRKLPTQEATYAMWRNGGTVLPVDAGLSRQLSAPLLSFRDRRPLRFSPAEVTKWHLERDHPGHHRPGTARRVVADGRGSPETVLGEKDPKGKWRIRSSGTFLGSEVAVGQILASLSRLTAKELSPIGEPPPEVRSSAYQVKLWIGKSDSPLELRIGPPDPKTRLHPSRVHGARAVTFYLEGTALRELGKPAASLEERRLLPIAAADVTRVTVTDKEGERAYRKEKEAWKRDGGTPDSAKIDAALDQLVGLEFTKRGEGAAPPPRVSLKLWKGEELLGEIRFGDKEIADALPATVSGRDGRFLVSRKRVNEILAPLR